VGREYSGYLAGKHALTANEIDQIGYRLAKELGHKSVYPVDADGDFPWQRVIDYAKASGRSKELDAITDQIGLRPVISSDPSLRLRELAKFVK
jgi:hypothetical protein